ncbi:MAG: hybrid sensor histidine kinase/response regulator [Bacteroidota bacterium]|nr:hybrid sensor histidine kinase/response regulator [Bacteroidota bacterium]
MENNAEKQFNILVVDDNLTNLQVLGVILNEADYSVGIATSGEQALSILKNSYDYDLVLLDINMPGMNGYDTCIAIKAIDKLKDMPVIFLTAYNDINSIVKGFESGAIDYVTKPFNSKELLVRVNTQLQLKQKNEQLKEYSLKLEKLNATKDKFFSIISHDLKNPLYSIVGSVKYIHEILQKYRIDEINEMIEIIDHSAKESYSLLENLMEWAKSQTGNIKFEPLYLPLLNIVNRSVDLVSTHASLKNIKIINNVSDNIVVYADEYMLESVMRNLLTNAVKYSYKSGIININAIKRDNKVEISIVDAGIGISDNIKNKLFKIDADNCSLPGTAEEKGTGLGLIICAEFIEKHRGKISVESEESKGSTFNILLPDK